MMIMRTALLLPYHPVQLKYCQVGKVVRVTDDVAEFQKRQKAHNMWNDNLVLVSNRVCPAKQRLQ